jgi:diaminopimelate epimerase
MRFGFEKYHGNGNDFIIIDDREQRFPVSKKIINRLCNRRFGIGADGLILVRNSDNADFQMLYYNADGALGTMCGNGGRCVAAFAFDHKLAGEKMLIDAGDGYHEAVINRYDEQKALFDVSLQLLPVNRVTEMENAWFLDTGSPHHVEFVKCVDSVDVDSEGKKIRYSEQYKPGGTNVNFVAIEKKTLFVRTYERGVENETLSCGTGVTASALAAFLETGNKDWRIKTRGGDFKVTFENEGHRFTDIWLHAPAQMVFKGETEC